MKPNSFDMLLDHLQRASMEDAHWEGWCDAAIEAFGAAGGTFLVLDSEEARIKRQHQQFHGIDVAALEAEYSNGPYLIDPALDRVTKCASSEIFSDFYHQETSDPMHRAFTDWRRSWGISPYHITTTLLVSPTLRATFCLNWSPDHGPSRQQEIRSFSALIPHINHALRFGFQHQAALQDNWWESEGGRSETQAMALLDERGFVVRMSPAFEALARAGGWLNLSRDWLSVRDADADRALQSALFRAVSGLETRTVSIVVPQSPRSAARLDVKPVARAHRYLVPHEAAALLHLHPRAVRRPSAVANAAS